MIVGYGFNDEHINEAIGRGVDKGLRIFIVDPRGVDVFDKFDRAKPLSSTFAPDRGELAHLFSFFK
jgi:hypothetical protein